MKKVAVFAVVAALAGCASDSETLEIVSASSEEIYTAEQLQSISLASEAQRQQAAVALEEKVVVEQPVSPTLVATSAPTPSQPEAVKPAMNAQAEPVAKAEPQPAVAKKPTYQYAQKKTDGYTIQVLALSHNKGFQPYLNKLPSNQPVWMNQKQVQGLPWYTLLYGHFETRQQAEQALSSLPNDVKAYGPFIRSLAKIKSSTTPKMTKLN
ncbi:SPOR domain-containing protein [Photobacterium sp. TY1-4]|uniref:SPOR domain-containing protein n=1 Tax=Photobacterium sp. TY1-4 TaxID=2899122 RepID=UPI0021C1D58D|nr:SPOR domain-containing protein [Photobacterium sp. TY1-4]UXI04112.1 SPOR domain-containing protein [Photobacterium sp. TY1-4]